MTNFVPVRTTASINSMLELVNFTNNKQYTFNQVSFGPPSVLTGVTGYNSQITMSAVAGGGYNGSVTFQYNRVDAGALLGNTMSMDSTTLVGSTVLSVLSQINGLFGLLLRADEVIDATIDPTAAALPITISGTSEVFSPASTFNIAFSNYVANTGPVGTFIGLDSTTSILGLDANIALDITA